MKVAITVTIRSTGLILMTSNWTFLKKYVLELQLLSSKFVGKKRMEFNRIWWHKTDAIIV